MTVNTTDAATPGTDLATIRANLPAVPEGLAEAYPGLDPDIDLAELMEDTLGAGKTMRVIDCTVVKVPSADANKVFMVPDENGNKMPANDGITGIPVAWTMRRSYWESDIVTGSRPDCSSQDLVTGRGAFGPGSAENPTGECATCPMSKQGSAGTGTQASKCKEQRVLFLLTAEEAFPYVFIVPPGSLPNWTEFGAFLAKRKQLGARAKAMRAARLRPELGLNPETQRPYRATAWITSEVKLTLEQDKTSTGIDYNKIKIRQVRELEPDEVAIVNMYGRTVDEMIADQAAAMDAMLGEADIAGDGVRRGTDPDDDGGTDPDVDLGDFDDEMSDEDAPAGKGR